ncbi:MAG: hypothetical protein SPI72_05835 [Porphyromonas sp.]|nr:hypothetical protein [Porphyromonas sp.]
MKPFSHSFLFVVSLLILSACNKAKDEIPKPDLRVRVSACSQMDKLHLRRSSPPREDKRELIVFTPYTSKGYYIYNHFNRPTPCDLTRVEVKIHTEGKRLFIEEKELDGGEANCICPRNVSKIDALLPGDFELILNGQSIGTHVIEANKGTVIDVEDFRPQHFNAKYVLGELPYLGLTRAPWKLETVRLAEQTIGVRREQTPGGYAGAIVFENQRGKYFDKVYYIISREATVMASLKKDLSPTLRQELIDFIKSNGFEEIQTQGEGAPQVHYVQKDLDVAIHFMNDYKILIDKVHPRPN